MELNDVQNLGAVNRALIGSVLAVVLLAGPGCKAAFESAVRGAGASDSTTSGAAGSPTRTEIARALREALSRGVDSAIGTLGRHNGFYGNERVRIPLPEDLEKPAALLRRAGQDQYVDEFITTMNRAAERAVPRAASIFGDSIRRMSIDDATRIIRGPDDAATGYFRRTASPELTDAFRPAVARATESVQLTQAYKNMLDRAGPLSALVGGDARDLDGYITRLAVDALFEYIAEEEQRIRDNPVARGSELLQRVFGYYEQR